MVFPKCRLDRYTDWDTKETTYSVTIIGFDSDYAQIELGPGPFGTDGYATEAEARAGAAAALRALADRIERGDK